MSTTEKTESTPSKLPSHIAYHARDLRGDAIKAAVSQVLPKEGFN
jgi:hypothetical protein